MLWFLDPKRRLRKAAHEIVEGLADGTLVPDRPLTDYSDDEVGVPRPTPVTVQGGCTGKRERFGAS